MVIRANPDQAYTGQTYLQPARFAGRSPQQIFDQYEARVIAAGGVIADEVDCLAVINSAYEIGIFDLPAALLWSARWGVLESGGSVQRVFGIGGIDMLPESHQEVGTEVVPGSVTYDETGSFPILVSNRFDLSGPTRRTAYYLQSENFYLPEGRVYVGHSAVSAARKGTRLRRPDDSQPLLAFDCSGGIAAWDLTDDFWGARIAPSSTSGQSGVIYSGGFVEFAPEVYFAMTGSDLTNNRISFQGEGFARPNDGNTQVVFGNGETNWPGNLTSIWPASLCDLVVCVGGTTEQLGLLNSAMIQRYVAP